MGQRKRTPPELGDFADPLRNYSPEDHADDLERGLCQDTVAAIEFRPFQTIGPLTPIREAIHRMAEHNIAALVVTEGGKPVGIFSERDVLNRVADRYADIAEQPVRSVMTPDPVVVYETDRPARALNLMAEGAFRHVPVVDADRRLIGVIGARRLTDYLQRRIGPASV